jgi:hypothetical protein
MNTSFSKLGYLSIKKESNINVPGKPDTYLELISEDIVINWAYTAVGTIAGNRSNNLRPVLNQIEAPEGSIEIPLDSKMAGHLLTMMFGAATDTTLTAGKSYQHDFRDKSTIPTYTFDVKVGGEDYVTRYTGVRVGSIELSLNDNKWIATLSVMCHAAFSNARVTLAASSGTSLKLDQTFGLTTSDTLQVLDKDNPSTVIAEYTIAAIVSEREITVSTISASLGVDDIVVIKAATPSYNIGENLIYKGGTEIYLGHGDNALQNLVQNVDVEEMTLTFTNEYEPRYGASGCDVVDRFPTKLLLKGWACEVSFNKYHSNPEFLAALRSVEKLGLRVEICGETLDTNSAVAATGVLESSGAGIVTVTADTAGEEGNDYAVQVVQGTSTLSASISGKMITVTLDSDAGDNTVALVAAVIDALSGVSAVETGSGNVTVTDNPNKIEFSGGRDANEEAKVFIDFSDIRVQPFNANLSAEDVINEEITATAFRDSNDKREVRVRLRNSIASY